MYDLKLLKLLTKFLYSCFECFPGLYNPTHLIQIIISCRMSLELDAAIPSPHLALPTPLRRHNTDLLVLIVAEDPSCLPPLVVGGIGHVQDVAVLEGQSSRGQTIVPIGIIVEQGAHIQRSLLRGPQQCARSSGAKGSLLFQLLDARLEAVILLWAVLRQQGHHTARSLGNNKGIIIGQSKWKIL